jgi:hypothetical protein
LKKRLFTLLTLGLPRGITGRLPSEQHKKNNTKALPTFTVRALALFFIAIAFLRLFRASEVDP